MSDNTVVNVITRQPIIDNHIINPHTGRKVKVGSRVFNQLLAKQVLKLDNTDTNCIIYEGDNPSQIKNNLKNITDDKHTTRVINGKVFKQKRQTNRQELSRHIQDISLIVYQENKHLFDDPNMPQSKIQSLLQNLINQKLVDNASFPTTLSENDKKIKSSFEYIVDNIPDEDEDDGDEDDEDDDDEDEDN
jgi:hypothetical protein